MSVSFVSLGLVIQHRIINLTGDSLEVELEEVEEIVGELDD